MTVTIDSNGLLRILVGDVPAQSERAVQWLLAQQAGSVVLLDAVLVEVLFQLEAKSSYAIKRQQFMPELARVFTGSCWRINQVTRQALGIFAETSFDYVDCLLLAMRSSGQVDEAFTFDVKLAKRLHEASV